MTTRYTEDRLVLNPAKKRAKKKTAKKKAKKKTAKYGGPPRMATPSAPRGVHKGAKHTAVARAKASVGQKAGTSVAMAKTAAAREAQEKSKKEAAKIEKKLATLAKAKSKSKTKIEELEKEIRSLRGRVGAQRKRGDLTAAQEKVLKERVARCTARLGKCKKACEVKAPKKKAKKKVAKKRAKKKTAKKKTAKKKGTKKGQVRKTARRAYEPKKKKAKKKTKKKVAKKRPVRVPVGSKRVTTRTAAQRKKAAKKSKACPTVNPRKKAAKKKVVKRKTKNGGPVKCRARPTASSMAACRRGYQSWQKSDKRQAKKKKSARATCGPGVPSKKAAGYMGGKQRPAGYRGKDQAARKVKLEEQKRIMARYARL